MVIVEEDMDGTEKQVTAGRTPLIMVDGKKYRVGLRGMGVYEGGFKRARAADGTLSGEQTDEPITNMALIVCNADDPEEEYIVSAAEGTVMATSILNFGQKDEDGVWWLKEELLNTVGKLGSKAKKTDEAYERGYIRLFWDAEVDKKDKPIMVKDAPLMASLVGSVQRGEAGGETEDEMDI